MAFENYIVENLVGMVTQNLANRTDVPALAPGWIQSAILELTRNYDFEELRYTGPTVQFVAGQNNYDVDYFLNTGDSAQDITRIFSWFCFYTYNAPPTLNYNVNSGIRLKYKTIESIEQMLQYQGPPIWWSRTGQGINSGGSQLYVALTPDQNYYTYMRYQKEHPFSNPIALTDPIYAPDDWIEIFGYAAAMRGAIALRMLDLKDDFHRILFGDPEFEASSGGKGAPGLIARRISRMEVDRISEGGQIRPMRR